MYFWCHWERRLVFRVSCMPTRTYIGAATSVCSSLSSRLKHDFNDQNEYVIFVWHGRSAGTFLRVRYVFPADVVVPALKRRRGYSHRGY